MKKNKTLDFLQKNYGWIVALITGVSIIITFVLKFIKYICSTFYFYYYGISYELFNSEELNILYNFGFSIIIILCICSLIYCYIQLFNSKKLELKTKALNTFLIIISNLIMVYSINTEYSIWNIIINTGLLIATEIIMIFVFFKKSKKEETEKLETKSILNSLKILPFYLIFVVFVILFEYGLWIKMNKTYRIVDNDTGKTIYTGKSKKLGNMVSSETVTKMKELMAEGLIDVKSRIIFVNDGSMDLTWKIIEDLHNKDTLFGGINLTRNRGHQNALLAGLMTVKDDADIVISLDADLQDDINVFDEMLRKNNEGYDVIYGVRNDRKKDSFFKRHTAQMFYKLTNKLGGDLIYNHADFRLMSRRALEGLAQFEEVNLFLRGIVPLIGYPSTIVEYERKERLAGKSKYPLRKMMSFAIEGITSLSIKPMRFVTGMGIFVFLVSIAMMIYAFVSYFTGRVVAGWTSILISVWAIGGMVLLGLGIVGSYIGKIYLETKKRPRYIVEKYINERE